MFKMATDFLSSAVHVSHNGSNCKTIGIPGYFFFKKPHTASAQQWATEQSLKLYPATQAQREAAQQSTTTLERQSNPSVLMKALARSTAGGSTTLNIPTGVSDKSKDIIFKRYGLGEADTTRIVTMYGLQRGYY